MIALVVVAFRHAELPLLVTLLLPLPMTTTKNFSREKMIESGVVRFVFVSTGKDFLAAEAARPVCFEDSTQAVATMAQDAKVHGQSLRF